jgi:hypothetical protein
LSLKQPALAAGKSVGELIEDGRISIRETDHVLTGAEKVLEDTKAIGAQVLGGMLHKYCA